MVISIIYEPIDTSSAYSKEEELATTFLLTKNFSNYFAQDTCVECPKLSLLSIIHLPPERREKKVRIWLSSLPLERQLEALMAFRYPRDRKELLFPLLRFFLAAGKEEELRHWIHAKESRLVLFKEARPEEWLAYTHFLGVDLQVSLPEETVLQFLHSCRSPKKWELDKLWKDLSPTLPPMTRTSYKDSFDVWSELPDDTQQACHLLRLAAFLSSQSDFDYGKVLSAIRDPQWRDYFNYLDVAVVKPLALKTDFLLQRIYDKGFEAAQSLSHSRRASIIPNPEK